MQMRQQPLPLPHAKFQHCPKFQQERSRKEGGFFGEQACGLQGGSRQIGPSLGVPHNALNLVVGDQNRTLGSFNLKRHLCTVASRPAVIRPPAFYETSTATVKHCRRLLLLVRMTGHAPALPKRANPTTINSYYSW